MKRHTISAGVLAAIVALGGLSLTACGSDEDKSAKTKKGAGSTKVRGRTFATDIPGSWQIKNRPATRSAVIGTWTRRLDPEATLVIAVTGKSRDNAEQSISKLRDSVTQRLEFEEIAFGRTTLGKQSNATRFAFRLGNTQKVIFAFDACGNKTVTLIGTAPVSKFAGVQRSFEQAASAFNPNCNGTLQPPRQAAAVNRALRVLAVAPVRKAGAPGGGGAAGQNRGGTATTATTATTPTDETDTDGTGTDTDGTGTDTDGTGTDTDGTDTDATPAAGAEPDVVEAADQAANELGVNDPGEQAPENAIESTEPPPDDAGGE